MPENEKLTLDMRTANRWRPLVQAYRRHRREWESVILEAKRRGLARVRDATARPSTLAGGAGP